MHLIPVLLVESLLQGIIENMDHFEKIASGLLDFLYSAVLI